MSNANTTTESRNNIGRFVKGHKLGVGRKYSKETLIKMREAKLKNPVRYWLGKKRKIAKNPKLRNDGYRYLAYSLIEESVRVFLPKYYGTRPVPEHYYVWCKHHKSEVPTGYVIHHINHNRSDNRIQNLLLIKRGDHSKYHNKGIKKVDRKSPEVFLHHINNYQTVKPTLGDLLNAN